MKRLAAEDYSKDKANSDGIVPAVVQQAEEHQRVDHGKARPRLCPGVD